MRKYFIYQSHKITNITDTETNIDLCILKYFPTECVERIGCYTWMKIDIFQFQLQVITPLRRFCNSIPSPRYLNSIRSISIDNHLGIEDVKIGYLSDTEWPTLFRQPNSIVFISLPYRLLYRHDIMLPISKRYQNGIVMSDLPMYMSKIYLTNMAIIGSSIGLSPVRHYAITWTNTVLLSFEPSGTNINALKNVVCDMPIIFPVGDRLNKNVISTNCHSTGFFRRHAVKNKFDTCTT